MSGYISLLSRRERTRDRHQTVMQKRKLPSMHSAFLSTLIKTPILWPLISEWSETVLQMEDDIEMHRGL